MKTSKRPPVHPGQILKDGYLRPLRLTTLELAAVLKVSRQTVSFLINGHVSVSTDMALRLSRALNTTPHYWLNLQADYDLYHTALNTSTWKTVQPIRVS
jgi:antitoxin HigA-1